MNPKCKKKIAIAIFTVFILCMSSFPSLSRHSFMNSESTQQKGGSRATYYIDNTMLKGAIQTAITGCNDGDVIYWKNGTYTQLEGAASGWNVPDNIIMYSNGSVNISAYTAGNRWMEIFTMNGGVSRTLDLRGGWNLSGVLSSEGNINLSNVRVNMSLAKTNLNNMASVLITPAGAYINMTSTHISSWHSIPIAIQCIVNMTGSLAEQFAGNASFYSTSNNRNLTMQSSAFTGTTGSYLYSGINSTVSINNTTTPSRNITPTLRFNPGNRTGGLIFGDNLTISITNATLQNNNTYAGYGVNVTRSNITMFNFTCSNLSAIVRGLGGNLNISNSSINKCEKICNFTGNITAWNSTWYSDQNTTLFFTGSNGSTYISIYNTTAYLGNNTTFMQTSDYAVYCENMSLYAASNTTTPFVFWTLPIGTFETKYVGIYWNTTEGYNFTNLNSGMIKVYGRNIRTSTHPFRAVNGTFEVYVVSSVNISGYSSLAVNISASGVPVFSGSTNATGYLEVPYTRRGVFSNSTPPWANVSYDYDIPSPWYPNYTLVNNSITGANVPVIQNITNSRWSGVIGNYTIQNSPYDYLSPHTFTISANVTPLTGNNTTSFTFLAIANDSQGQNVVVNLNLDNVSHLMTQIASDLYSYSTVLSAGHHQWNCTANNTTTDIYSSNGSIDVSAYSPPNYGPIIVSGSVAPVNGTNATNFEFSAYVYDLESDPIEVNLNINGTNYTMNDVGSNRYNRTMSFSPNNYVYSFYANDSSNITYLAGTWLNVTEYVYENQAPTIIYGMVIPSTGSNTTNFTFIAFVNDTESDSIVVNVNINGTNHTMTYQGDNEYTYNTMFEPGTYIYNFYANDTNISYLSGGSIIVSSIPNQAPVLLFGTVIPTTGDTMTTFNFSSYCYDPESDPITVRVNIDGTNHTMTSFATNQYRYTAALAIGTHYYTFYANDTQTSTLTGGSIMVSPYIPPTNLPPQITSSSVSPTSGNLSTIFTFSVTAIDAEHETLTKWVIIDGTTYDMTPTYQTTLAAGTHTYQFYVSDGTNTVSSASSTVYVEGSTQVPVNAGLAGFCWAGDPVNSTTLIEQSYLDWIAIWNTTTLMFQYDYIDLTYDSFIIMPGQGFYIGNQTSSTLSLPYTQEFSYPQIDGLNLVGNPTNTTIDVVYIATHDPQVDWIAVLNETTLTYDYYYADTPDHNAGLQVGPLGNFWISRIE